ncbi:MAG: FAD-dependent oxidoreductase [Clostridia bacterium]|nr:FAD-dependent oxidoreductase [Clostridia bacterium]
MQSVWFENINKPEFDSLDGNCETDVLIIGGGLAGILCAYMLEQKGVDYLLIEADRICCGVTADTTAKVTAQHGLIYDKIISKYGLEYAREYYNLNSNAVKIYRDLCKKYDCNFETKSAYVYSLEENEDIENEIEAYRAIGIPFDTVTQTPLPLDIYKAIRLDNQGQINPLELLFKISENLNIREKTKLINLDDTSAETDCGRIKYKRAVFTTHFPILNKHGLFSLKMYQDRSYVIALENAQDVDGMYIDASGKGLSFRNYRNLLLLGGGSHRTGKKGGSYTELLQFTKTHYPEATVKTQYATQDCMTLDSMPYIGQYSKNTPNLFVATGFNKWGFTSAMVAAELLCDMLTNSKNIDENANIYSPSRSIFHPQLAVNIFESFIGLILPTVPRCPHLGCALKYNKAEHSWDCPCHGSRFTEDGKLINNPATDDKQF